MRKKISIGVFIDLNKAFDTVNHDLLIYKLEYGIRGIAQEWLKSYLKDRKQFVQIDECASTLLSVTCGIPQVSIWDQYSLYCTLMIYAMLQLF